ncbi:MAG: hypothetical protein NZ518_00110, partial [Dehalococcoidia bacterium]|nr:hypothetical protein [Dehalococcoidia bacterium]
MRITPYDPPRDDDEQPLGRIAPYVGVTTEDPGLLQRAIARKLAQTQLSAAHVARDLGLVSPEAGERMIQSARRAVVESPADVSSLEELIARPGTAAAQAVAEQPVDLGVNVAGRIAGGLVGAAISALPGLRAAKAARSLLTMFGQEAGGVAASGMQAYGAIREQQLAEGVDDRGRAAAGALLSGLVESGAGLESVAGRLLRGGRAALGSPTTQRLRQLGQDVARGAAIEGATEYQQAIIEQAAAGRRLLDPETQREAAFEAAMGALGGGPVYGAIGQLRKFAPSTGDLDLMDIEDEIERASRARPQAQPPETRGPIAKAAAAAEMPDEPADVPAQPQPQPQPPPPQDQATPQPERAREPEPEPEPEARPEVEREPVAAAGTQPRRTITEQAIADAARMPDIADIDMGGRDAGQVVAAWISALPDDERADVVDSTGALTTRGRIRARAAVVAKGYGDPKLAREASQIRSDDRGVSDAVVKAASYAARIARDRDADPAAKATLTIAAKAYRVAYDIVRGRHRPPPVAQDGRGLSIDDEIADALGAVLAQRAAHRQSHKIFGELLLTTRDALRDALGKTAAASDIIAQVINALRAKAHEYETFRPQERPVAEGTAAPGDATVGERDAAARAAGQGEFGLPPAAEQAVGQQQPQPQPQQVAAPEPQQPAQEAEQQVQQQVQPQPQPQEPRDITASITALLGDRAQQAIEVARKDPRAQAAIESLADLPAAPPSGEAASRVLGAWVDAAARIGDRDAKADGSLAGALVTMFRAVKQDRPRLAQMASVAVQAAQAGASDEEVVRRVLAAVPIRNVTIAKALGQRVTRREEPAPPPPQPDLQERPERDAIIEDVAAYGTAAGDVVERVAREKAWKPKHAAAVRLARALPDTLARSVVQIYLSGDHPQWHAIATVADAAPWSTTANQRQLIEAAVQGALLAAKADAQIAPDGTWPRAMAIYWRQPTSAQHDRVAAFAVALAVADAEGPEAGLAALLDRTVVSTDAGDVPMSSLMSAQSLLTRPKTRRKATKASERREQEQQVERIEDEAAYEAHLAEARRIIEAGEWAALEQRLADAVVGRNTNETVAIMAAAFAPDSRVTHALALRGVPIHARYAAAFLLGAIRAVGHLDAQQSPQVKSAVGAFLAVVNAMRGDMSDAALAASVAKTDPVAGAVIDHASKQRKSPRDLAAELAKAYRQMRTPDAVAVRAARERAQDIGGRPPAPKAAVRAREAAAQADDEPQPVPEQVASAEQTGDAAVAAAVGSDRELLQAYAALPATTRAILTHLATSHLLIPAANRASYQALQRQAVPAAIRAMSGARGAPEAEVFARAHADGGPLAGYAVLYALTSRGRDDAQLFRARMRAVLGSVIFDDQMPASDLERHLHRLLRQSVRDLPRSAEMLAIASEAARAGLQTPLLSSIAAAQPIDLQVDELSEEPGATTAWRDAILRALTERVEDARALRRSRIASAVRRMFDGARNMPRVAILDDPSQIREADGALRLSTIMRRQDAATFTPEEIDEPIRYTIGPWFTIVAENEDDALDQLAFGLAALTRDYDVPYEASIRIASVMRALLELQQARPRIATILSNVPQYVAFRNRPSADVRSAIDAATAALDAIIGHMPDLGPLLQPMRRGVSIARYQVDRYDGTIHVDEIRHIRQIVRETFRLTRRPSGEPGVIIDAEPSPESPIGRQLIAVAEHMTALSAIQGVHRKGLPTSASLDQALREVGAPFVGVTTTDGLYDGVTVHTIAMHPRQIGQRAPQIKVMLYAEDRRVVVDSTNAGGDGGAVYKAIYGWALANGYYVFPDEYVTVINRLRRIYSALSSILHHSRNEHIRHSRLSLVPLAHMASPKAAAAVLAMRIGEIAKERAGLERFSYNFETGEIYYDDGRPVTLEELEAYVNANDPQATGVGINLARLAIYVETVKKLAFNGQIPPTPRQLLPTLRNLLLSQNQVPDGAFDPKNRVVYLFAGALDSEERAKFVAAHEIVGHYGLRGFVEMAGGNLDDVLRRIGTNPFIRELAASIAKERRLDPVDLVAVEEAVAETAAAVMTGDWDYLAERYGVSVPSTVRDDAQVSVLQAIIDWIADFFRRLIGRRASDREVLELIARARAYVWEGAPAGGGSSRWWCGAMARTVRGRSCRGCRRALGRSCGCAPTRGCARCLKGAGVGCMGRGLRRGTSGERVGGRRCPWQG